MTEKNNIIPYFVSEYSIGKSILTLEDETDIKENKPVSIFAIAKTHKLNDIFLVDNSLGGFIKAYQNSKKHNIRLHFGYSVYICNDASKKTEDGIKSESKITIWMKNSDGYKDLVKIATAAECEGFYYHARLDWEILAKLMTNNLFLSIPFYDSFIHKNHLQMGNCMPSFNEAQPIFEISEMGLPFDQFIVSKVNHLVTDNNYNKIYTHPIFYYSSDDFIAYQVFRCINKRATHTKPNLDHFSVDTFSWEHYVRTTQI